MSDINFSKLTWENLPARTTALSAQNLNRIENGIADSVNGVNSNRQMIAQLQTDVTVMRTQVGALANGSPTPVETKAEMTEETSVYLYVGDEEGESTGYWYSYDSTEEDFVPRGEYGGAVTDTTLSVSGAAADAEAVRQALAEKADSSDVTALDTRVTAVENNVGNLSNLQTENKTNLVEAINEAAQTGSSGGGDTVPMNVRQAIYDLFKTALYDSDMPEYSDLQSNLAAVLSWIEAVTAINLFPRSIMLNSVGATSQLTATTVPAGGTIVWSSSDESVATVSQTGLVTITGFGSCTITATCGFVSASCSVVASSVTLSSISAVYTPSGKVYTTDTLDSLKSKITVTAHWSDSSTSEVSAGDYVLSGTLTKGTSVITVGYGGKSDTVSVTVTGRYTVTNNLTNATTSNNSTGVDDGASYTATLTAGAGYSAVVATVTMGGTDVTSTAYNNGVVSIASVTGNVVITAHGASAFLYHYPFSGDIASIGQKDFGLDTYGDVSPTFITESGEQFLQVASVDYALVGAVDESTLFDGDFTISFYMKAKNPISTCYPVNMYRWLNGQATSTKLNVTSLVEGYEFTSERIGNRQAGIASSLKGSGGPYIAFMSADLSQSVGAYYKKLYSTLADGNWHSVILQRSNGVITFYIDKTAYWSTETSKPLYVADQIAVGGEFSKTDAETSGNITAAGVYGIKDLIIHNGAISISNL